MSISHLQQRWNKLTPETRINNLKYPVIALTGGIGSGKSTIAKFFAHKGVPYISADTLVKKIYAQAETRSWLAEHHPDVINPDDGSPNFYRLREKAFTNPVVRAQLESWIYPRLPATFEIAERPFRPIQWLVYEIPLLFERKMESFFDGIILSWVPREIQTARVIARDSTKPELVEAILQQQIPIDQKKLKSDLVFDNSITRTEEEVMVALESIWRELIQT